MERVIQTTGDGSDTIAVPSMAVTYHSTHGAIRESMHVFINAGWRRLTELQPEKKNIHILEMGFGTGLNALLTCRESAGHTVHYEALEQYPLPAGVTNRLHYHTLLNEAELEPVFAAMHDCEWDHFTEIVPGFYLCKRQEKLEDFCPSLPIDLVYFDAFAPGAQPELWTPAVFSKLYTAQSAGGVLVTYCSKGDVRRALLSAGYQVEKIPGPPGKEKCYAP
ncbi:MAG: tRNA (5-methylaminomethyl-2-thiouridine)(34)-methyltransferase MnmD [Flavihumibacter sp.]